MIGRTQSLCDQKDPALGDIEPPFDQAWDEDDPNPKVGQLEQPAHDNHTPAGTLVPTAVRTYMPHAGRLFTYPASGRVCIKRPTDSGGSANCIYRTLYGPCVPRGQGETPIRSIRVPDPLWGDARRACDVMGTTVNAEIVKFLERLVRDHPIPPES